MKEHWIPQLKQWIQSHGGQIHPSLTIQDTTPSSGISSSSSNCNSNQQVVCIDSDSDSDSDRNSISISRGVFATSDISKGELLISIPSTLVISGEQLPQFYHKRVSSYEESEKEEGEENEAYKKNKKRQKVNASPWLRCVSAFISTLACQDKLKKSVLDNDNDNVKTPTSTANTLQSFTPYINSLPTSYETLLQETSWSNDEIQNVLSGTTLGKMLIKDRQSKTLRERYVQSIRPYLQSNHIIIQSSHHNHVTHDNIDHNSGNEDGNEDEYFYNLFINACNCISTRGFHLKSTKQNDDDNNDDSIYSGPFLLPFIDLLNHSSMSSMKCTTLQRGICNTGNNHKNAVIAVPSSTTSSLQTTTTTTTSSSTSNNNNNNNETFFMIADRDIKKGEEILHSYGDDLTSTQSLQTFGFVEDRYIQRASSISPDTTTLILFDSQEEKDESNEQSKLHLTPVILSKTKVIKACRNVTHSTFPDTVKTKMLLVDKGNQNQYSTEFNVDEQDDDDIDVDEVWDLPTNVKHREKDTINVIPDEILIHCDPYNNNNDGSLLLRGMLSDELVTLCCIQFLPDEAYDELLVQKDDNNNQKCVCLLEKHVLEDYYLGKLVCKAILNVIEERLAEYEVIKIENILHDVLLKQQKEDCMTAATTAAANKLEVDQILLRRLLSSRVNCENNDERLKEKIQHLMYGLTIRIEEKLCLMMLKKAVVELFDSLDDDR